MRLSTATGTPDYRKSPIPLPCGMPWSSILSHQFSVPTGTQQHPSAGTGISKVPGSEMHLFEFAPTLDKVLLTLCEKCGKVIRAQKFAQHLKTCGQKPVAKTVNNHVAASNNRKAPPNSVKKGKPKPKPAASIPKVGPPTETISITKKRKADTTKKVPASKRRKKETSATDSGKGTTKKVRTKKRKKDSSSSSKPSSRRHKVKTKRTLDKSSNDTSLGNLLHTFKAETKKQVSMLVKHATNYVPVPLAIRTYTRFNPLRANVLSFLLTSPDGQNAVQSSVAAPPVHTSSAAVTKAKVTASKAAVAKTNKTSRSSASNDTSKNEKKSRARSRGSKPQKKSSSSSSVVIRNNTVERKRSNVNIVPSQQPSQLLQPQNLRHSLSSLPQALQRGQYGLQAHLTQSQTGQRSLPLSPSIALSQAQARYTIPTQTASGKPVYTTKGTQAQLLQQQLLAKQVQASAMSASHLSQAHPNAASLYPVFLSYGDNGTPRGVLSPNLQQFQQRGAPVRLQTQPAKATTKGKGAPSRSKSKPSASQTILSTTPLSSSWSGAAVYTTRGQPYAQQVNLRAQAYPHATQANLLQQQHLAQAQAQRILQLQQQKGATQLRTTQPKPAPARKARRTAK